MLRSAAFAYLILIALSAVAFGQIPSSLKLSLEDEKGFTQELDRVRSMLNSANNRCAIEFQMARTYAAGGQYTDAMRWLERAVASGAGFDPSRDKLFDPLRETREFRTLMARVEKLTPSVSTSSVIGEIPEPDLKPENLAFDANRKRFFLGSTAKDEIVACDTTGRCHFLVSSHQDGLGYVLGIKLDRGGKTLWATSNEDNGASLRQYDIESGRLLRKAGLRGEHLFNDVSVSSTGRVFVTDTKLGAVFELAAGVDELRRVAPAHAFTSANGIALSPDEGTLYVADFEDGIAAIDLSSGSVSRVAHPPGVCLAYIDGLYATHRSLIAIQNGPMLPRVVQFDLKSPLSVAGLRILERRNPLFDGITTGALVDNTFYYLADGQASRPSPIRILSLKVN